MRASGARPAAGAPPPSPLLAQAPGAGTPTMADSRGTSRAYHEAALRAAEAGPGRDGTAGDQRPRGHPLAAGELQLRQGHGAGPAGDDEPLGVDAEDLARRPRTLGPARAPDLERRGGKGRERARPGIDAAHQVPDRVGRAG